MVGAVLTQNTAWGNVEKAISALRRAGALHPAAIATLSPEELKDLIRPAGFYHQKAATLRQLSASYDLDRLSSLPLDAARTGLLAIRGIGPETADAILLYAARQPSFVVDAYTRRLCQRLGLVSAAIAYAPLRQLFMDHLDPDTELYNEYHALIVVHGKERCRKHVPRCTECPLVNGCSFPGESR